MKINALRKELKRLLEPGNGRRRPAIRRSLLDDWIYAADLPEFVPGEELEAGCRKLREAGWETLSENGWLQLRKPADEPPEDWFEGPFGPEAECCRSLLSRHPEQLQEKDWKTICSLIHAGEEGPEAYEDACRRLHHLWAERLRKKQKLPEISLFYFGGGK